MTLEERIMERVEIRPWGGCWMWSGGTNDYGYGEISIGQAPYRKMMKVHRLIYHLKVGQIPEGMLVLHRCDTPRCCNPAHLFLGTAQDNMDDMAKKGRRKNKCLGRSNGQSKLNDQAVIDIRRSKQNSKRLADVYGVSSSTINRVRSGEHWGHVDAALEEESDAR